MKINGGFESLFEYSSGKHAVIKKIRRFNTNPRNIYLDQYIGSFQPIVSIGNDFLNTVGRYKSMKDMVGDVTQPIEGFVNLFKGLKLVVCLPFMLAFFTRDNRNYPYFQETTLKELAFSGSWLIHGVMTALRGITQIATTPFTWIVKIPLRAVITAIYGFTPVEESLKYLIKHAEKPATEDNDQSWMLAKVLHKKYMKAACNRQPSIIGYKKENAAYKPLSSGWRYKITDVQNYFTLFASPKSPIDNSLLEENSINAPGPKL